MNALFYLIKGFKLLTQKGLRRYLIIPLFVNILLFSLFIGFGLHWISALTKLLPHWLYFLKWLFDLLFILASSVIIVYVFTLAANLIGAPFNNLLSEKVELIMTGHKPTEGETFHDVIKDMPRVLKRQWDKIRYYIPRAILLLLLYLVPGVNLIAGFLWLLFSAYMMAMQYIDYPLDNHKTTFAQMKEHLKTHLFPSLAFGFSVLICSMIPIVNFAVMPAAVCGATLMYLDQKQKQNLN